MNGRLQGFLNFLDLLAEGQRRQAEVVTGRGFEPVPGLAPVQAANVVKIPLTGHQKPRLSAARPAPRVGTRH